MVRTIVFFSQNDLQGYLSLVIVSPSCPMPSGLELDFNHYRLVAGNGTLPSFVHIFDVNFIFTIY